ncbi:MarR family winged helix-turn-helix transcriptional regulator [Shivajiella indica]|uniref:MarR family winged helix-turn-helix transcriptional regulator n=1 Tax=Shivajiella indica TaxID=872115 RepID=A0ABW5BFH2_9BACT
MEKESLLSQDFGYNFYVASRLITQAYREPLEVIGLTYPQYLVMLALWEEDGQMVSRIGDKLQLDSGTLTPLLKRLESLNLVKRERSEDDERKVVIQLTYPGKTLQNKAQSIPEKVQDKMEKWPDRDRSRLKSLMGKLIDDYSNQ